MVNDHLAEQLGATWEKSTNGTRSRRNTAILCCETDEFHESQRLSTRTPSRSSTIAPSEILVVLDDLALPLGRIRIRPVVAPVAITGWNQLSYNLERRKFRVSHRIGRSTCDGGNRLCASRFFEEERPLLKSAIERGAQAIECAVDNGVVSAMNTFNQIQEP